MVVKRPSVHGTPEREALQISQPSSDVVRADYLGDAVISPNSTIQSKTLRYLTTTPQNIPLIKPNFVTHECWDEWERHGKNGSFAYPYSRILLNSNGYFSANEPGTAGNTVLGFIPTRSIARILPKYQKNIDKKIEKCASMLVKYNSPTTPSKKDPILLIHGYSKGKMAEINNYFHKLPKILMEAGYPVYGFFWNTNQRFEDAANNLGAAIKEINKEQDTQLHIVAHSFGGLLARTLVQGLAKTQDDTVNSEYDADFMERRIATITTVGTPHSGVFGTGYIDGDSYLDEVSFDNNEPMAFNYGRHGVGHGIEFCASLPCQEAGELWWTLGQRYIGPSYDQIYDDLSDKYPEKGYIRLTYDTEAVFYTEQLRKTNYQVRHNKKKAFGVEDNPGQVVYRLAKSAYPNVPTQVLIGIIPTNQTCKDEDESDDTKNCKMRYSVSHANLVGDGLISLAGQRFYPWDHKDDLLKGNVEEHLLGFNASSKLFKRGWQDDYIFYINTSVPWTIDWSYVYTGFFDFKSEEHPFQTVNYNHRGSEYDPDNMHAGRVGNKENSIERNIPILTEVGLQNCTSPTDCNHATWDYVNSMIALHPAVSLIFDFIPTIKASGNIAYTSSTVAALTKGNTASVAAQTTSVNLEGFVIKIYLDGELLGTATTDANGAFEKDVEFKANRTYVVEIHAPVSMDAAQKPKVAVVTKTSAATVEETNFDFSLIELVKNERAPLLGNLGITLKNGDTGEVLLGYNLAVSNVFGSLLVNKYVDVAEDAHVTLPHGQYAVRITTPGYNFTGYGSLTCTVSEFQSSPCVITITDIVAGNQPPIANAQSISVDQNSSDNAITLTGSDPEADDLAYTVTHYPQNGKLSGTAPNITYTPNGDFTGPDSFTFKVNDGEFDSLQTAIVTLNVTAVTTADVFSIFNSGGIGFIDADHDSECHYNADTQEIECVETTEYKYGLMSLASDGTTLLNTEYEWSHSSNSWVVDLDSEPNLYLTSIGWEFYFEEDMTIRQRADGSVLFNQSGLYDEIISSSVTDVSNQPQLNYLDENMEGSVTGDFTSGANAYLWTFTSLSKDVYKLEFWQDEDSDNPGFCPHNSMIPIISASSNCSHVWVGDGPAKTIDEILDGSAQQQSVHFEHNLDVSYERVNNYDGHGIAWIGENNHHNGFSPQLETTWSRYMRNGVEILGVKITSDMVSRYQIKEGASERIFSVQDGYVRSGYFYQNGTVREENNYSFNPQAMTDILNGFTPLPPRSSQRPIGSVSLLEYESEMFDLKTGAITQMEFNDPEDWAMGDFYVAYNSNTTIHSRIFFPERAYYSFIDERSFSDVSADDISSNMFIFSGGIDMPFENNDTIVIYTDEGNYFKIGNAVENEYGLSFDYQQMTPQIDPPGVYPESPPPVDPPVVDPEPSSPDFSPNYIYPGQVTDIVVTGSNLPFESLSAQIGNHPFCSKKLGSSDSRVIFSCKPNSGGATGSLRLYLKNTTTGIILPGTEDFYITVSSGAPVDPNAPVVNSIQVPNNASVGVSGVYIVRGENLPWSTLELKLEDSGYCNKINQNGSYHFGCTPLVSGIKQLQVYESAGGALLPDSISIGFKVIVNN